MANGSGVTRFVRFARNGDESYGILAGDTVRRIEECFIDEVKETGESFAVSDVKLLTPIAPERVSKIVGVNGNYQPEGQGRVSIPHPPVFVKFSTSLATDGDDVELPSELRSPYFGSSLVVVIGKEGRNISRGAAAGHVFGVAVGNDVSDADSWGREFGNVVPDRMLAKACDTWAPVGTQIVAGLDFDDLKLEATLNGEVVAGGRTGGMVNDVPALVHYLSHYFTLSPGDLIFTGTPQPASGPAAVRPGDQMEVRIEGLGSLSNRCTELKRGAGRHWWHDLEDELAAQETASPPPAS